VLTQSDDEGGPKKYDHGDYVEDAYEEDETGRDYGERYDSDSYANEDGDGEDDDTTKDSALRHPLEKTIRGF
jgi:hypothetical protein